MRRQGSRFFTIVLIALLGYVAWQLYSLKREVTALRAEIAAIKANRTAGGASETQSISLISTAKDHLDQARKYLGKGDTKRAKQELENSLRSLDQAYRSVKIPSGDIGERVLNAVRETRDSVEQLWHRLGAKPNSKGD
ncbi:MAG: hypothetical protein K6U00_06585 [Armatimonadetes bacterium]|nr:hypothetical protein [Armatimonadota bacterium]